MSDLDRRAAQIAEQPEAEFELPAFRTMGRGYKFVFTRLPVFARLGWLDFCYGLALFLGTEFIDELLLIGQRPQSLPFRAVLLPLMGFFVLRFAVRCHRYAYREERMDADRARSFDISPENATAYAWLFFICALILALPLGVAALLIFAVGIPDGASLPMAVVIIVVDCYLAARMSILFAQTALTGRLPPRWTWSLSKGLVWKLMLIVALAPWPFNTALKLLDLLHDRIDWSQIDTLLRVPLIALGGVISFAGVAVLATILSNAYWVCAKRNYDMIERAVSKRETAH